MEQSKFEREVLDRLMRLETKIDMQDYKGIQEKVENSLNLAKKNDERINKIEDAQRWLLRLIIGLVVTGVLAFIYNMYGDYSAFLFALISKIVYNIRNLKRGVSIR